MNSRFGAVLQQRRSQLLNFLAHVGIGAFPATPRQEQARAGVTSLLQYVGERLDSKQAPYSASLMPV